MSAGRTARRPVQTATTGLLVLGVAGGLLSGCSSAVEVAAAPSHASPDCARAAARWPSSVATRTRRAVTPQDPSAAAWGDPAVIATCGWPEPGPTSDQCLDIDGVDWVAHPLSDGVQFRTFGRSPALEVLVPKAYAPEPLVLPAFGPAARALPATGRTCS
ncbi:DUF3515 family protein [Nostocoides sp. HKS02]|uniref:DUF3515 family protein n=1 Tax=Nostocoides sp. HKS02 TaxID=1813880 RepID=UPI001E42CC24|nr:DUF3515 family protein [Tetrasphaera sp. HKS02]